MCAFRSSAMMTFVSGGRSWIVSCKMASVAFDELVLHSEYGRYTQRMHSDSVFVIIFIPHIRSLLICIGIMFCSEL